MVKTGMEGNQERSDYTLCVNSLSSLSIHSGDTKTQGPVSSSLFPLQFLPEHPASQFHRLPAPPGAGRPPSLQDPLASPRAGRRGDLGRASWQRRAGSGGGGEGCRAQPGKWGENPPEHIPSGEQGHWGGAVTRALPSTCPLHICFHLRWPCMRAGRKVAASDTGKVLVPPSISASHRPGSGLRCSSHCTGRWADPPHPGCLQPWLGSLWVPGVLQGTPAPRPAGAWEPSSLQRTQPQCPWGAGAVLRCHRNIPGWHRPPGSERDGPALSRKEQNSR